MASGSEDLAASAGGVTVRERPCWLCVYNTDEVVQKVCALIAEHGWTGTEWHCCKDLLCYLLEFTRTSDFWADSLSIAQCRKHDKMGYQNLQSDLQAALPQRQGRSTSYLRTGRLWPASYPGGLQLEGGGRHPPGTQGTPQAPELCLMNSKDAAVLMGTTSDSLHQWCDHDGSI
eukprot:3563788-Rhodomonas_salina.1